MIKNKLPKRIFNAEVNFTAKEVFKKSALAKMNTSKLIYNNVDYCLGEKGTLSNIEVILLIHQFGGVFDEFELYGPGGGNPCYHFYIEETKLKDFYIELYQTEDLASIGLEDFL